jgi:hypothetical protein
LLALDADPEGVAGLAALDADLLPVDDVGPHDDAEAERASSSSRIISGAVRVKAIVQGLIRHTGIEPKAFFNAIDP